VSPKVPGPAYWYAGLPWGINTLLLFNAPKFLIFNF
jgi:hypothetical protein